jgi:hypothetical protein
VNPEKETRLLKKTTTPIDVFPWSSVYPTDSDKVTVTPRMLDHEPDQRQVENQMDGSLALGMEWDILPQGEMERAMQISALVHPRLRSEQRQTAKNTCIATEKEFHRRRSI